MSIAPQPEPRSAPASQWRTIDARNGARTLADDGTDALPLRQRGDFACNVRVRIHAGWLCIRTLDTPYLWLTVPTDTEDGRRAWRALRFADARDHADAADGWPVSAYLPEDWLLSFDWRQSLPVVGQPDLSPAA